jgi:hypothetical protein
MRTRPRTTIQLGELIVAIFDEATRLGGDRKEITRLATRAVMHLVRSSRMSRELERAAWFGRTGIMSIRQRSHRVLARSPDAAHVGVRTNSQDESPVFKPVKESLAAPVDVPSSIESSDLAARGSHDRENEQPRPAQGLRNERALADWEGEGGSST